jgi:hypothetical protein
MEEFALPAGVPVRGAKLALSAPRAVLESRGLQCSVHFGVAKLVEFARQVVDRFEELVPNLDHGGPGWRGCRSADVADGRRSAADSMTSD